MKKRRLVTLLLPSLLLAPLVLSQAVQADEVVQATSERTENISTEAATPVSSEPTSSVQQPAIVEVQSQASSESSAPEKQEEAVISSEKLVAGPVTASSSQAQAPLAFAQEVSLAPSAASSVAKGQDLSAYTGSLSNPALADKELTLQEAVDELLNWAAVNNSQLSSSAQDRVKQRQRSYWLFDDDQCREAPRHHCGWRCRLYRAGFRSCSGLDGWKNHFRTFSRRHTAYPGGGCLPRRRLRSPAS